MNRNQRILVERGAGYVTFSTLGKIVLVVLAAGLSSCSSFAKINPFRSDKAEVVTECDKLAAAPEDAGRWATAVKDPDIVPALAAKMCLAAVSDSPKVGRFQFQLGRALLAGERQEEAEKAFQKAVDLGYCPAKFYLGLFVLENAKAANDPDMAGKAGQLMQESRECGYAAQVDKLIFTTEGFGNPKIIEALWEGRITDLNQARLLVAAYCKGIHDYINLEFFPTGQACPGFVAKPEIGYALDAAIAGDPRPETLIERPIYDWLRELTKAVGVWVDPVWQGDIEKYKAYLHGLGRRDAIFMTEKYECRSEVTETLYGQVVAFAYAKRPFAEYSSTLMTKWKELFAEQVNGPPPGAPSQ